MKKILLVLFLVGCSYSPNSPEGLLKMFISDTSTKNVGRDYYEKYTTGNLLKSLDNITDEDLDNSKLNNVKQVKTKILNKKCDSADECVITFIVEYTYQFKDEGVNTYSNEVKKIAEVAKVDDMWKLSDVTNLKTFISTKEPIDTDIEK